MPTWLAIAIPSVVAVAAILMWALDYSKKAHEIAKLRLELEKLKREGERSEREEQSRASGLYTPTAAEVDEITHTLRVRLKPPPIPGLHFPRAEPGIALSPVSFLVVLLLLLYAVIRLVVELNHLVAWILQSAT